MINFRIYSRHATRVKNLGGHIVLGGDNMPPLVEIGLTDVSKSGGGARAPPASHLAACLYGTGRREFDFPVKNIF